MSDERPGATPEEPAPRQDSAGPEPKGEDAPAGAARTHVEQPQGEPWSRRFLYELTRGSIALTALSILLALVIGAILIAFADEAVREAAGYFFARPGDFFAAVGDAVGGSYASLFSGSVIDFGEYTIGRALSPLANTFTQATPLIAAGLAVTLAFRAGLFNIGAEGQIIVAAIFASYVGFGMDLPVGIHLIVAVLAGMLGGAIWGGIVGLLKARTGAHEVIVTIMLNYVARFLVAFVLTTAVFQRPGASNPVSPVVDDSAILPRLLGETSRLHLGFLLVLLAAAFVWWLLERSTIGFEFRAVGANPNASRTAGISVGRSYMLVMLISGALAGLAGVAQVLGTERYLTTGVSSGFGFDAITVALLGRASPWGTVAAGILFGALRAGGVQMQASAGTPVDIVLVIQSLIVLFIAAPPLIRSVFRLKVTGKASPVGELSKGWSA